jgi:hypothetical protein
MAGSGSSDCSKQEQSSKNRTANPAGCRIIVHGVILHPAEVDDLPPRSNMRFVPLSLQRAKAADEAIEARNCMKKRHLTLS